MYIMPPSFPSPPRVPCDGLICARARLFIEPPPSRPALSRVRLGFLVCVCVCMCVCGGERERDLTGGIKTAGQSKCTHARARAHTHTHTHTNTHTHTHT